MRTTSIRPVPGVAASGLSHARGARRKSALRVGLLCVMCAGCADGSRRTTALPPRATPDVSFPLPADVAPADAPGLHNLVAYHDGLLSGSAPEGRRGFDTLAGLGIRTIISVDGAQPDVEAARARGMRYVHLPIGYDGMDRQRTLELARAVKELPGPIYVHCHHGKHRSAAAVAAAAVTLGYLTRDHAQQRMGVSGTAPSYAGLYRCVAIATVASSDELATADDSFPERWQTSGLVSSMVEIDQAFERLKAVERAGWTVPADHPDLVPAAEAGRLADLLRNLQDDERCRAKAPEFMQALRDAAGIAARLEEQFVSARADGAELGRQFARVTRSCRDCHAKYRD